MEDARLAVSEVQIRKEVERIRPEELQRHQRADERPQGQPDQR
jgi:hypothetical protein